MPERDALLTQTPAQEDVAALLPGREIYQAGLGVAQDDPETENPLHVAPKRSERLPVRLAALAAAVGGCGVLHRPPTLQHHLARFADSLERRLHCGNQVVAVLHREHALRRR